MSHIVVLGAGLGGLPAAYDLRIAVGWRTREQITFDLEPFIRVLRLVGIVRLHPK